MEGCAGDLSDQKGERRDKVRGKQARSTASSGALYDQAWQA